MKRTTPLIAAALVAASAVVGIGPGSSANAAPMTFLADTLSDNTADGYTLRDALADADANPGPDTVGFAAGLTGTLTLNGTSLSSSESVTIEGPAGGGITIDGNGASRVLNSFFPGSDLTVRNLTMTGGAAAAQGAAIAVYQGNDVVMERMRFVNNKSAEHGGAVSVGSNTGKVDIRDSEFVDNTAEKHGGALYVFEHDAGEAMSIHSTQFRNNTSTSGSGGAIRADLSSTSTNFRDVIVDGNMAVLGDAGGLFVSASFVEMADVSITGNTAFDDNGGASIRSTSANVNLSGLTISGNDAFEVGGASIRSASVLNFADSVVSSNTAASTAGVRLQGDTAVRVRRSTIEANTATTIIGGLAVIETPEFLIEESTIQDNRAPGVGGIYIGGTADARISNSTVARNIATSGVSGGVVATGTAADVLTVHNSTISTNSASVSGGGIGTDDVELIVSGSTIVDNTAGASGGGIFQNAGSVATIAHSIVTGNSAPMFDNVNGPVFVEWSLLGNTDGTAFAGGNDNLLDIDPRLGPLADNGGPTSTHLPEATSPVVDAGNPNLLFTQDARDQRGDRRLHGAVLDIGAVERSAATTSIWTPVIPARVVDTRDNGVTIDGLNQAGGPLAAASQTTYGIAGRAGVPVGARGVVVNVTAVRPDESGFFTVHPCGDQLPLAASLNYVSGVTVGNEIIIGLDDAGALCAFTSASAHLTIDVVGYIGDRSVYVPTEPARFLETRAGGTTLDGESQAIGRLTAGQTIELKVRNRGDVDVKATAAVMYVTAIRPDAAGFVTIWNCATDRPLASSLNFVAGVNRGNEVVMDTDGHETNVCIYTSQAVDLTVDVVGFVPNLPNNHSPLSAPARFLDSRPDGSTVDGEFAGIGMRTGGSTLTLKVGGRSGVPVSIATVTMNLTAVRPAAVGYVTAFPCGGEPPLAASLNHVPGVNGGNEIIASPDASGNVCLFTSTDTHLTVDVTGYTTS